jgi:hypothetical protein
MENPLRYGEDSANQGQVTESAMKHAMLSICLGMFAFSAFSSANADDSNADRPIMTYKQKMKMCLNKARQNDSNSSDAELKKVCIAKLQSYEQHPSETKVPPTNPTP